MTLDLDFRAEVDVSSCDVRGANEYFQVEKKNEFDFDFEKATAYVDFELVPDAKNYGIRGIDISVKKITCSLNWYVEITEETTPEEKAFLETIGTLYESQWHGTKVEGVIEIDTTKKFNGKDWHITTSVEFTPSGGCTIESVEINLHEASIEIS